MIAWLAAAWGGELLVTSTVPVEVLVDGFPVRLSGEPGFARVTGLLGQHAVEIRSPAGQVLQATTIPVPDTGATSLTFDGANLVVAAVAPGGVRVGLGGSVAPPAPSPAPQPETPRGPALDEPSFARLLDGFAASPTFAGKLAVVQGSAGGLTVDQLGRLVGRLKFPADQLALVIACRPRVVDPEHAPALAERFKFPSDRDAVLALFP